MAKAWRGEGAWHFINPLLAGKRQKKICNCRTCPVMSAPCFAKRHRLLMKRRGGWTGPSLAIPSILQIINVPLSPTYNPSIAIEMLTQSKATYHGLWLCYGTQTMDRTGPYRHWTSAFKQVFPFDFHLLILYGDHAGCVGVCASGFLTKSTS